MQDTLNKYPEEIVTYRFDFSDTDEIATYGDSLSSIQSVTADTGITVGSSSLSGNTVLVTINGGTANTSYGLVVLVNLTSGARLAAKPRIYVQ